MVVEDANCSHSRTDIAMYPEQVYACIYCCYNYNYIFLFFMYY